MKFFKIDTLKSKRKLLELTRLLTENCLNGSPISHIKPMSQSRNLEDIRGWRHFKEIFMVSSLTGDGLDTVRDYLVNHSHAGNWPFPPEIWTNESTETVILNTVKATLLDFLPQEIPYNLKPQMEMCEEKDNGKLLISVSHSYTNLILMCIYNISVITTVVLIKAPGERMCRLVAGQGDGRLRQITQVVQNDLQSAFQKQVRIKLVLIENK